jgi:SPP1 family predicted phage head-tail adaptor
MFRPTPSGELRKVVQLVQRNSAQDATGQATGYTSYATVHAKIEEANANEVFKAQQYTSEVSHLVTIRYTRAITPKSMDRVLYGTRTFDIKSIVNPEERNIEWHLLCLELDDGVPPGA